MKLLCLSLVLFVGCQSKRAQYQDFTPSDWIRKDAVSFVDMGDLGALATQGSFTTAEASMILKNGGNLIDAFVAASFLISVERPQSTGLGGGGFLNYYDAKSKKFYIFDFRERAPLRSRKEMYLDSRGNYLEEMSKDGVFAVATPGLVRGLWEVHRRFGKKPWKELLQPAIDLAERGFEVYPDLAKALESRKLVLKKFSSTREIFLKEDQPLKEGERLVQKDLARTLRAIAEHGAKEFYEGSTAKKIITYMKKHQGFIGWEDLEKYRVIEREPVRAKIGPYEIVSMPPPSSGGIHVIQYLKMILSSGSWTKQDLSSVSLIHHQAAALQMAFADRAVYLGDPDFVKVPVEKLLDSAYLSGRFKEINPRKARRQDEVSPGLGTLEREESTETTHMSMMDHEGNALASTQTINGWMGSGVVVPGTGILLNNEMDDFSAKPGSKNLFGAVGSLANSIEPLKTPLSSMSPTLVLGPEGRVQMAVGAPGGTRIISCTALTIFNHIYLGMPLDKAVQQYRIHHQWSPDKLFVENPGPGDEAVRGLRDLGYDLEVGPIPCRTMAVSFDREKSKYVGVSDPRDIGHAKAW